MPAYIEEEEEEEEKYKQIPAWQFILIFIAVCFCCFIFYCGVFKFPPCQP